MHGGQRLCSLAMGSIYKWACIFHGFNICVQPPRAPLEPLNLSRGFSEASSDRKTLLLFFWQKPQLWFKGWGWALNQHGFSTCGIQYPWELQEQNPCRYQRPTVQTQTFFRLAVEGINTHNILIVQADMRNASSNIKL